MPRDCARVAERSARRRRFQDRPAGTRHQAGHSRCLRKSNRRNTQARADPAHPSEPSHRTVIPVNGTCRAAMAREKNIDVASFSIAAHCAMRASFDARDRRSWRRVFIGFSLRKWIGAPVGRDNWFDGRFGSHTTDNGGALELRAALKRRRHTSCGLISPHAAAIINELQAHRFRSARGQLTLRSSRTASGHCRKPRNRKPHNRLPARLRRDAPIPWLAPGGSRYEAAGRPRFGGTTTRWCGIGERFP